MWCEPPSTWLIFEYTFQKVLGMEEKCFRIQERERSEERCSVPFSLSEGQPLGRVTESIIPGLFWPLLSWLPAVPPGFPVCWWVCRGSDHCCGGDFSSHLILPESAAEGKDWKVDLETFESLASPLRFAFLTKCSQPGAPVWNPSAHLQCLPPTSYPLTLVEHSAVRRCRWIVQFIENREHSMGDCCGGYCGGCSNSCQAWLHGRKTPESLPP